MNSSLLKTAVEEVDKTMPLLYPIMSSFDATSKIPCEKEFRELIKCLSETVKSACLPKYKNLKECLLHNGAQPE